MEGKIFPEAFDMALFNKKPILIDEQLSQNCDFLIMDLTKFLNYSIYLWNDSEIYLKNALSKYNVQAQVASIYSSVYSYADILDDIYTQRLLGYSHKSRVNVFRSGTATKRDYYGHSLVIRIEKLPSGCSSKLDGVLTMFFRDIIYCTLKYKILADKVLYFD